MPVSLELQCWDKNQYTRRECLEIIGLPEINDNGNLEDPILNVRNKIGVNIDSRKVAYCPWIKTQGSE